MDKVLYKILMIIVLCVLLCSCASQPNIRQPVKNIAQIELVRNMDDGQTVLHTITDDAVTNFMHDLLKLKCYKRFQPIGDSSELEIWIYYTNGDVDIVGSKADRYIEQGQLTIVGWHYYTEEDICALFDSYIPQA